MIELLFSDSAAASLACAKKEGGGAAGTTVVITAGKEGNVSSVPCERTPYRGPTVDGSPGDIVSLWLMADIGDVSDLPGSRTEIWEKMRETYVEQYDFEEDERWPERLVGAANECVERLCSAARSGEPVRVWWSDAPAEACGFCWAMDILKDSAGPITAVKLPPYNQVRDGYASFGGTGELSPEWFPRLLALERNVERAERNVMAAEWKRLARENAPLRAVVNGRLHSVPADFYDFALRRALPASECEVARVVGSAVGNGPSGVGDWWYAWRLQGMIESGEITVIRKNRTFYSSTIKPACGV